MSDWDDDDFEPDTAGLAPPPEEIAPAPAPAPNSQPKPAKKKEINMADLGRELTAAELEELQKRNDRKLAAEMFGMDDDEEAEQVSYKDIVSKEEFEEWGTKIGTFLATRHKAANYGYLINKLILAVSEKLDAAEIRKISTHLKMLADSKRDEKPKAAVAGKKPKAKTLKGAGSKGGGKFDDMDGGADDYYDEYDDFM